MKYERAFDFSAHFIVNAQNIVEHGRARYLITDQGDLSTLKKVSLDELGQADIADQVDFFQGDASNLKPNYQNYDLIFAGNLTGSNS
ncbi:hypothetical protein [Leucothrix arctica]|uniref:hypothetical protein n=1 Tax=Leucothrix arctica TaxID=1481894 RepID=UPI0011B29F2F|nr:hypothetical protein [Leucothrix arctica]